MAKDTVIEKCEELGYFCRLSHKVILDKSLNLSKPQVCCQEIGDDNPLPKYF